LFDNAFGCATELFSGAQHIWPQEAVAHQGFSAGGFVLPFVRGVLGLGGDASRKEAVFAPCFPADWPDVEVENFRLGPGSFGLKYDRVKGKINFGVVGLPGVGFNMVFAPSFGPGTEVLAARVNGKPAAFKMTSSARIARPEVRFVTSGQDTVEIDFEPTVEILPPAAHSKVGDPDSGMKVIHVTREGGEMKVLVEGLAGQTYSLGITCGELIREVQGAAFSGDRLEVRFPTAKETDFLRQEIVIRLKD